MLYLKWNSVLFHLGNLRELHLFGCLWSFSTSSSSVRYEIIRIKIKLRLILISHDVEVLAWFLSPDFLRGFQTFSKEHVRYIKDWRDRYSSHEELALRVRDVWTRRIFVPGVLSLWMRLHVWWNIKKQRDTTRRKFQRNVEALCNIQIYTL